MSSACWAICRASPDEPLPKLKDRKFVEIDRDNFNKVLEGMKPRLAFKVDNKLTNDDYQAGGGAASSSPWTISIRRRLAEQIRAAPETGRGQEEAFRPSGQAGRQRQARRTAAGGYLQHRVAREAWVQEAGWPTGSDRKRIRGRKAPWLTRNNRLKQVRTSRR